MVVKTAHHDVAAFIQTKAPRRGSPYHRLVDRLHPGAARIDQHPRRHRLTHAARIENQPPPVAALGADTARVAADRGAPLRGIHGVEHHEARVIGETVGIFVAVVIAALERHTRGVGNEIDRPRAWQKLPPAEQIVDEQAEPEHQRRAVGGVQRQHETQRPHQMRRHPQQHLALVQRLAHQPELAVLEIPQTAVDQLRGGRRSARREIVLFAQQDLQSAPGRIAGNAGAVDAAADDREIEVGH